MPFGFGSFSRLTTHFLSDGGPTPPANVTLPSFIGTPRDGESIAVNVGVWAGAVTAFDLEVRSVEATPVVYFARATVTHDTAITLSTAVGKTLEARVWAKNGTAETLAVSAPWGPILAAGDQLVIALAWSPSAQSLPQDVIAITGASTATAVVSRNGQQLAASGNYPIANPNTGMAGLSFGAQGSDATISSNSFGNGLLKGRKGSNLSAASHNERFDLPGPGTYIIYAGLGASSTTITTNLGVWQGPGTTTSLHQMGPVSDADSGVSIVDAAGNVAAVATWAAAAGPGMGAGVEIVVTGATPHIVVGRSTNGGTGATQLNSLAIYKKAA